MHYSWLVTLNKNYAVALDVASIGERETVFLNGEIIVNKDNGTMLHSYQFTIENRPCRLKMFALNNFVPIFVHLYVDGKKVMPFKQGIPIPEDIDAAWLHASIKPSNIMSWWYMLFIPCNMLTAPLIKGTALGFAMPFMICMTILNMARTNPGKLSVKTRVLSFCVMTAINFIVSLVIYLK